MLATQLMMASQNTSLITSGMVLYLDAGNPDCYPGSGSTVFDLSGNANNGTLFNVTYSATGNGSFSFNGNGSNIRNFPSLISGGLGSRTICAMVRTSNGSTRQGIAGIRSSSSGGGWVLCINRTSPGAIDYFHTGASAVNSSSVIAANSWNYVAATFNGSTRLVSLYSNGSFLTSATFSSDYAANNNYKGVIGDEDESYGSGFIGLYSQYHGYNRLLSAAEIAQNFNAIRSRYGI